MSTIRLQNDNGYLYPTDAISGSILANVFSLGRIPCNKFWFHSPIIVKRGYSMAITGNTDDID